jgi:HK97 family phage prohead protease
MIRKFYKAKLEDLSPEGSYIAYIATFGDADNTDKDGDFFYDTAFDKTIKKRKGIFPGVHMHNFRMPVAIGRVEKDSKGLVVNAQLNLEKEIGRDTYSDMKKGIVGDHSIGFNPNRKTMERLETEEGYVTGFGFKEVELMEFSPLTIGFAANDDAQLVELKNRKGLFGNDTKEPTYDELIEAQLWVGKYLKDEFGLMEKTVVAYQDLPLADRTRAWNASGARQRMRQAATNADGEVDFSKYRRGFLWFDQENADTLGAYKLPIADIIGDRLTAVPRGIFAAAAATLGARGGVDIPAADIKKVQNHLQQYYDKMDLDSPFKSTNIQVRNIITLDGEKISEYVASVTPGDVDSVDKAKAMADFTQTIKQFRNEITQSL